MVFGVDRNVLVASWHSWLSQDNRPRAGPWWLQWLWTLLFCMGLAVGFTMLGFFAFARGGPDWGGWFVWYGRNLVVCTVIGALIHVMFDVTRLWFASPERVRAWRPWQRSLYFSGLPLLGVALGWPLGVALAGGNLARWLGGRDGVPIVVGTAAIALTITFVLHHWFASKSRQIDAERRATEAQLRLLQAQIEPHFLFNTLANVLSLIDHDTPKARLMLESFTDYLRSSLTTLRGERATLGSELELAQAYLSLLKTRMEERLQFDIDADPALGTTPLPPLLLQPLVENAIHHGLEPKVEGGRVRIRVRRERRDLVIDVLDDGLGPDAPAKRRGAGMALDNLRQRLQAHYGSTATVTLAAALPGTRATLRLPLETAR